MLEQEYLRPKNLNEAVEMLDKYGKDLKILAGGTDLIILVKENMIPCKYFMDIKAIPEALKLEHCDECGLSVGAGVTLNDLLYEKLPENYDILKQCGHTLANSLLRNRATLVGNICNASPGGDMLPGALVLEGVVHTASKDGNREIPLKDFFLGVKKTALKPNEMVTKVSFPAAKGKGIYMKKQRIKGHDLAQVSVAVYLKEDGKLLVALGAVAPTPVLIEDLGSYSKDELKDINTVKAITQKVMSRINPIGDQRSSREYRIAMAEYFTEKALQELAKEV